MADPKGTRLGYVVIRAVLLACVMTMVGCASLQSAPSRASTQATTEPARPLSPSMLRRFLIDDPVTFKEAFDALPDAEVQQIVSATPNIPGETTDLKSLLFRPVPIETKNQVLKLAEPSFVVDGKSYDSAALRTRFIETLGDDSVRRLATTLVQVYKDRSEFCRNKKPRIHNIGLQSILTFEGKATTGTDRTAERAVRIPFDGRDLQPLCVRIGVLITGTVPLSNHPWGVDFRVFSPSESLPDGGDVILLQPLIERLKTGDQLTVQMVISQAATFIGADRDRVASVATRTFTVYEIEDYRRLVLSARIRAHDINAFPLPETDAEVLFGSLVARDFFVVRLSVRNTDSEAKLISTGMIRAHGRAIVEPTAQDETAFTVPITVVPSSMQQTYTMLDDEEVNQPRAWVFRALEFTGALASAATAAFGVPVDVLKGISLFTGVGIPEGKKLFPDRWPGYKRNVVTYGMPDLLKVPANSVGDHKFLFFAKRNLEGIMGDPNLFNLPPGGNLESLNRTNKTLPGEKSRIWSSPPGVRVISVAFDNLDIRYEKVFDISKLPARQRIGNLIPVMQKEIDALSVLDTTWTSESNEAAKFGDGLTVKSWKEADALIKAALSTYDQAASKAISDNKNKQKVHNLLSQLAAISQALRPNIGSADGFRKDLLSTSDYGLGGLRSLQPRLNQLAAASAGGADLENEPDVKKIEEALTNSQRAFEFYGRAAQLLANAELTGAIKDLRSSADAVVGMKGDQTNAKKAFSDAVAKIDNILSRDLSELSALRPNGVLKLMIRVDWSSLGATKNGG